MVLVLLGAALSAIGFAREASASTASPDVQAGSNWRELRIGAGIDMTVGTVNPLVATLVNEFYLWTNVYSYLINAGPSFEYEPDLAVRRTEISSNPSKWDIALTRNAYFVDPSKCIQDPGTGRLTSCPDTARTPVKASDVKFTYDYVFKFRNSTAYMAPCIDRLKEVRIIDDYHLTIEFLGPYAPAEYTFYCIPILPEYYWTGKAVNWPAEPPVGSGPYLARTLGPGEGRVPIKLDRNPFWHGPEVVGRQQFADSVIFLSETSSSAHVQKLLTAETDLTFAASPFEWKIFLAGKPGIKRQNVYGTAVAQANVNVLEDDLRALTIAPKKNGQTNPLLLNWEVRAALHMATDRQRMIDEGILGLGVPADTLVPIDHPWHYDITPPFSWADSYPEGGDGNPFDYRFPALQNVPGGVPELLEEFPEGKTDSDGDKIPDSVEVAKLLLHQAGWLVDCDTGEFDTTAAPAFPLCKIVPGTETPTGGTPDLNTRLRFTLKTFNNPPYYKTFADVIIQNAAQIGIEIILELTNISGMNNAWYGGDYEMWIWGWVLAANLDVSSGIMSIPTCDQILNGLSNDFGYCPRDENGRWIYDDLYNTSLTATNSDARRTITNTLQKMVYDHGAYNLPFYWGNWYAYHELRWTNYRDWTRFNAIPSDIGNPPLIGQWLEPVDNRPPQFELAPFAGFVARRIQFSVSAIDPEGLGLAYRWDFDSNSEPYAPGACPEGVPAVNCDGIYDNDAQSTAQNPTFTYSSAGPREVTVRASEVGGEWFTVKRTTVNVVVGTGQQTPDISAVGFSPLDPATSDPGVTFAATASDPGGLDLNYFWDFGDGTTAGPFLNNPVSPRHLFPNTAPGPETFEVRARATNSLGLVGEFVTFVTIVDNVAPFVAPIEDSQAVADANLTYVGFASDPNARDGLTYEWDFDFDGTTFTIDASGNPTTHIYTTLGDHPLRVRVTDTAGNVATEDAIVTVITPTNHGPYRNEPMSATPSAPYTTQDVVLRVNVSDPEGNPLHWAWNLAGGVCPSETTTYDTAVTVPNEPVVRTVTCRPPPTGGTWKPGVTITDIPPAGSPHGLNLDVTITATVNRVPVVSAIGVSPGTTVNPGQEVTFSVTSSDADGNICDYSWDFSDGPSVVGTTSIACSGGGLSPRTHTYTQEGQYLVSVTVDDRRGGLDSSAVLIDVIPPQVIDAVVSGPWTKLFPSQTMDLTVAASVGGVALPGATVTATLAGAGTLTPASGTTDANGVFKTTVKGNTTGTTITLTASVSKSGYVGDAASYPINIVQATTMTMVASTKTVEMMSFETATFAIRLTDATGAGLLNAQITGSSLPAGTFAPAEQLGGGDYRLRWSAPTVTTQTLDSISIRTKVGGYLDAIQRFSLKVDPNMTGTSPLHTLFVLGVPASVTPGGTVTIRAYVYTIEGFVVAGSAVVPSLRFATQGTLGPVADQLNGLYEFTFTAAATLSPGTIVSIKIDVSKIGYAAGTTTVRVLIVAP